MAWNAVSAGRDYFIHCGFRVQLPCIALDDISIYRILKIDVRELISVLAISIIGLFAYRSVYFLQEQIGLA